MQIHSLCATIKGYNFNPKLYMSGPPFQVCPFSLPHHLHLLTSLFSFLSFDFLDEAEKLAKYNNFGYARKKIFFKETIIIPESLPGVLLKEVYVVVNFLTQVISIFPLFWVWLCMPLNLKQRKNKN